MNSKEEAEKIWSGDWHTKTLRLHPEYMGRRKAQVTVHNVPLNINADHLEVFFNQYGEVKDVKPVVGKNGYRHGDYMIVVSVTKEQFYALPETIIYNDRELSVLVAGRVPSCWLCKERGHIARVCPKKTLSIVGVATAVPATLVTPETPVAPVAPATLAKEDGGWKVVGHKKGAKPRLVLEDTEEEDMEVVQKVVKRKKEESQESAEETEEEIRKKEKKEERKKARRAKREAPKSPIKATTTNPSPMNADGPNNADAANTTPNPETEIPHTKTKTPNFLETPISYSG